MTSSYPYPSNVFPEIEVPTTRTFKAGTWAVQSFRAMSGAETRILYGDKQLGAELILTYKHLRDDHVKRFFDHFADMKGTYQSFVFIVKDTVNKRGWDVQNSVPDTRYLSPSFTGDVHWRYKEAPQMTNIYPGYSDLKITLVGVNRD